MWRCQYINRQTKETYWRSVFADSESEAEMLARRMARKGFIVYKKVSGWSL